MSRNLPGECDLSISGDPVKGNVVPTGLPKPCRGGVLHGLFDPVAIAVPYIMQSETQCKANAIPAN